MFLYFLDLWLFIIYSEVLLMIVFCGVFGMLVLYGSGVGLKVNLVFMFLWMFVSVVDEFVCMVYLFVMNFVFGLFLWLV